MSAASFPSQLPRSALRASLEQMGHELRYSVAPLLDLMAYAVDASAKLGDGERVGDTLAELLTKLSAQLVRMGEQAGDLAQKTGGR